MTIELEILRASNSSDKALWKNYWSQLKAQHQDVCFLPEYLEAYQTNADSEAMCAVCLEGRRIWMYVFLKRRIVNFQPEIFDIESPYGYSGSVINVEGDDNGFIHRSRQAFNHWCFKNRIITEFCRFHPLISNESLMSDDVQIIFNRTTVAFDLSTYPTDFLNSSFYLNHRGMINRANRDGLTFAFLNYSEHYSEFYEHYIRTQHALQAGAETYFPISYFRTLANLSPDNIKLGVVSCNEVVQCAVIVLAGKELSHLHLMAYYVDKSAKGAVNYLYHCIALYFASFGYKYLQVGGGKTSADDDPLFLFKKRLSPVRKSFFIGKRVHNSAIYQALQSRMESERPDEYQSKKHLLQFYR